MYQVNLTDEEWAEVLELCESGGEITKYPQNCYFILSNKRMVKLKGNKLVDVYPRKGMWGVSTKDNPEQTMALDAILDPDIPLVAITGHAGTGKTFISLLGAFHSGHSKVIYTRDAVESAHKLGFLPGGTGEKFQPYLRPMRDNLEVLEQFSGKRLGNSIITEPLEYMRGATLRDTVLIVDEAQNCDRATLKMAISRASEGSKVILCGSYNQIDTAGFSENCNGLKEVVDRFYAQEVFTHIHMSRDERSVLARLADQLL